MSNEMIKVEDVYQGMILPDGNLIALIIGPRDVASILFPEQEEEFTDEQLAKATETLQRNAKHIVNGFLYNWEDIVDAAIR